MVDAGWIWSSSVWAWSRLSFSRRHQQFQRRLQILPELHTVPDMAQQSQGWKNWGYVEIIWWRSRIIKQGSVAKLFIRDKSPSHAWIKSDAKSQSTVPLMSIWMSSVSWACFVHGTSPFVNGNGGAYIIKIHWSRGVHSSNRSATLKKIGAITKFSFKIFKKLLSSPLLGLETSSSTVSSHATSNTIQSPLQNLFD